MRGKTTSKELALAFERITPAHAGKRNSVEVFLLATRDHPRTCGEKVMRSENGYFLAGSPPHMRGKEYGMSLMKSDIFIIPAHAGKKENDHAMDDMR